MLYVLLPRRSQRFHAVQPHFQSTTRNADANTLFSPSQATKTHPSTAFCVPDASDDDALALTSSDEGDLSVGDTMASDHTEAGVSACSSGLSDNDPPVVSAGGKRLKDCTSSEYGNFSTRNKAGNLKRKRGSEPNDSDGSAASSTIPKPSRNPKRSTGVDRKQTKHQPREKVSKWSNPKSHVAIVEEGSVIRFTFDGHECTHSSGFASDTFSESDSFSSADFDHSCAALKAFNMCFYRPLNAVFCKTHRKCIPLGSLQSHISSSILVERHSNTLPRMRKHKASEIFISHIASAFNLRYDQTFHLQGADIIQLPNPIPCIEEPRKHLQCPECKVWLRESDTRGWKSDGLRQHLAHKSKCALLLQIPESERPALKECYGQRPCGLGGHGREMRVPFVEIIGWSPTTLSSEMPSSIEEPEIPMKYVDPSSQEYAKVLKWDELVSQETAECLRLLCLLPHPSRSKASTSAGPMSPQNRANILERGLHEVHLFLQKYLEEANDFIDSCDAGLRLNLTEGSVLKLIVPSPTDNSISCRTNSHYNVISTSAYAQYRRPLTHAIALLLRYKLYHELGQRVPGNFKLPMTKSLNDARIALYEFLISVPLEDEIDRATLGIRVHALSVSLLTARCTASIRIGHIFDITLPTALYRGSGVYTTANTATQYCAGLQFCLRSVAIQATRLGGIEKLYIPFQKMTIGMEESIKVVELNYDSWGQGDEGLEDLEDLDAIANVTLRTGEARREKVPEPIVLLDGLEKTDANSSLNGSSMGSPSTTEELGNHALDQDPLLV